MKKISFLFLIAFLIISCNKTTKTSENSIQPVANEGNVVEVLYFHGKQRCMTCNAIEKETRQLVDSVFAKEIADKKLIFKVVDFSQKENEALAEKYEIAFSSLLVNDWTNGEESVNNMTDFAFANARSNPAVFKSELQRIIGESLAY